MVLLDELRNISATKKDLRNFGLIMAVAMAVIGGFLFWKENTLYAVFFGCAAGLVLTGLSVPVLLWPFHRVWMILAGLLGWVMGRLILSLLYYVIMTPMGLLGRLFGKTFLDTKTGGKNIDSYWSYRKRDDADEGNERYENQF